MIVDQTDGPTAFLAGGGEMAGHIAAFDWSRTALGPVEGWPRSLKAVVGYLVHCPVPLVLLWGDDGIMIYNDAYSLFAGDNHPAILGSKVREGWPAVADFNDKVMRTGLAGGALAYKNHELTLYRDGVPEPVWMNLDYSPVYDDAAKPAGVLAIVIETTETVRAEAALRESEARLRFLDRLRKATAMAADADEVLSVTTRLIGEELGVSNCAYADMDDDADGFTIRGDWAREGSPAIVGHYSLAAFGTLALEKLHAGEPLVINDNRAELAPHEAAAFQSIGISATICMPLVKDGRLAALMAIHHKDPHIWSPHELATIREVTERSWAHVERVGAEAELRKAAAELSLLNETLEARAAERSDALLRSQTQFRLLVQGVTDYAIYMLDPDGYVSSWNAGAERIKGYSPEEIIGQHFSRFYPDDDRAAGEPGKALETARRDGRFAAEGWRVRKDGSRFRASVVIDAIHDDQGNLVGFAKITRDVTEREAAQRELEQAREALFQSQKMDAIGQLTGGVAHDFNNLLMAILSSFALLRKRVPDDPQIMRLIDNGVQGAERGAVLTQRMLAFARRQELKPRQVDLPELVIGMKGLLERTIGPAWPIDMSFPGGLDAVSADANQLELALLNLVVNARDAMPEGGRIRIEAKNRPAAAGDADLDPGDYVQLSVIDEGVGMDAATLERASEPFFTTKGVGKGTGLGLSMIHGYARQLGGTLVLDSEPGAGTRAHVWLPVSAVGVSPEAETPDEPAPPTIAARTVLAVDDDALVLMNTSALLEDLGHRVIEANSGTEALELFLQRPDIDLLVTDQAMPGMTGSELIEAVRQRRPDLPVILATGYGETPADGVVAVVRLGKPFNQPDLQRALATALG